MVDFQRVLAGVQQRASQFGTMLKAYHMMPAEARAGLPIPRIQRDVSTKLQAFGANRESVAALFMAMEDYEGANAGLFEHLSSHGFEPHDDNAMEMLSALNESYPDSRTELVDSLHSVGCTGLDQSVARFFDNLTRDTRRLQKANEKVAQDIFDFLSVNPEHAFPEQVKEICEVFQGEFMNFVDSANRDQLTQANTQAKESLVEIGADKALAEAYIDSLQEALTKELIFVNHLERSGLSMNEETTLTIQTARYRYEQTQSIEAPIEILKTKGYQPNTDTKADLATVLKELSDAQKEIKRQNPLLIQNLVTKHRARNTED